MEITQFAPVLIPTLNRYEHFKRCVESLAKCTHAEKTDLFIALDYPLKDSHWEGYEIIKEYVKRINGFKSITIIQRKENYGPYKNFFDTLNALFNEYDRVIFSEDDNFFAKDFLSFVNKGLTVYEGREDIFAVTGYSSPNSIPDQYTNDSYLLTAFVAWGVGVWREKWEKVTWDFADYDLMLNSNMKILKKYYRRYLPQLLKIKETQVITADGYLFLHLLHKKLYSVFPRVSLVRNMGHDGSGVHCKKGKGSEIYLNQTIYEGSMEFVHRPDIKPDKQLIAKRLAQVKLNFYEKIRIMIPIEIRHKISQIISFK